MQNRKIIEGVTDRQTDRKRKREMNKQRENVHFLWVSLIKSYKPFRNFFSTDTFTEQKLLSKSKKHVMETLQKLLHNEKRQAERKEY